MGMTKEQRRRKVFLVGQSIFPSDPGFVRDRSAISKIVAQNRHRFAEVLQGSNESSLVDTILTLFKQGIFESELKARSHFSELFKPPQERSLQHEMSEQEAIQSKTEAPRQLANNGPMLAPPEKQEPARGQSLPKDIVSEVLLKAEADVAHPKESAKLLQNRPSLSP
ncbi:MAG: hypothetical protein M1828_007226, partial [Chrysothrix sp. TS-e1954]